MVGGHNTRARVVNIQVFELLRWRYNRLLLVTYVRCIGLTSITTPPYSRILHSNTMSTATTQYFDIHSTAQYRWSVFKFVNHSLNQSNDWNIRCLFVIKWLLSCNIPLRRYAHQLIANEDIDLLVHLFDEWRMWRPQERRLDIGWRSRIAFHIPWQIPTNHSYIHTYIQITVTDPKTIYLSHSRRYLTLKIKLDCLNIYAYMPFAEHELINSRNSIDSSCPQRRTCLIPSIQSFTT